VVARAFALTDVGRSREHNEDTFLVADLESGRALEFARGDHEIRADAHGLLFLVADGMGGAASGELASSMASELVLEGLRKRWTTNASPSAEAFAESLRDVTMAANTRIHLHARDHSEHRGMGTTATIAGLLGDRLYLVQVGDSRAYLVRDGIAQQLTKDQSLMQRLVEAGELTPEEAEVSDRRNIILQALGPEAHVTVDLTHQQLRRGDTLILCSDGLSGMVKTEEIASLTATEPDVRLMCRKLVDRANARGGPDNITVVAVRFEGEGLTPANTTDTVGYTAFPLAGTLFEQTKEIPVVQRESRGSSTRTPTPKNGMRRTTPKDSAPVTEPEHLFVEKRLTETGDDPAADRAAARATDMALADARRRAIQPVLILLAAVAITAAAWTVLQFLRG
jgi:serine/threonine protein phosphatase PrpC